MAVKVCEFVQTTFKNAGVTHYDHDGDYYSSENLYLDQTKTRLRLAPAWSNQVLLPQDWLYKHAAVFISAGYFGVYAFIGQNYNTNSVQVFYITSLLEDDFYVKTTNVTGNVAGKAKRNAVYYNGRIYLISTSGVWAGAHTGTSYSQIYVGSDARILAVVENEVYLLRANGAVMRLNAAETAFEAYYTPAHPLDPQFLTHFRGYILYAASRPDGSLDIYRLNSAGISEIASVAGSGRYLAYGSLFAVHDDNFYFSPGIQRASELIWGGSNADSIMLYEFNGSQIALIAETPSVGLAQEYQNFGILNWRAHLLYYDLRSQYSYNPAPQYVDMLRPNKTFSTFMPLTMVAHAGTLHVPVLHNLGGELLLIGSGTYTDENPL